MNPGTSRLAWVATLCAMSMAVMGCTDAFTVHSIIEKPNEPGAPHSMHGLWVHQYDSESYAVLQIARVANPERACEVAGIGFWEEPAALGDAPLLEGRACLTEMAGQTVVEISTLTQPILHLQYLVRLGSAELSICGLQTVWGIAWDLSDVDQSDDTESGAGLDGLEYTRREAEKYEQIFLISDGEKLRAYLDANLPRIVLACDEGDGKWEVFKRATPLLVPTTGEESEEGSRPSPPLP